MPNIRSYKLKDYAAVKALYLQTDLYGGQFSEARDSKEKLSDAIQSDPQAILVCEERGDVLGTVSLIENGRVAWLFRFAVKSLEGENIIAKALYKEACNILISRGHTEVLLYSPKPNAKLDARYMDLGLRVGGTYTCFWQSL